jgi:hypothetical protein
VFTTLETRISRNIAPLPVYLGVLISPRLRVYYVTLLLGMRVISTLPEETLPRRSESQISFFLRQRFLIDFKKK